MTIGKQSIYALFLGLMLSACGGGDGDNSSQSETKKEENVTTRTLSVSLDSDDYILSESGVSRSSSNEIKSYYKELIKCNYQLTINDEVGERIHPSYICINNDETVEIEVTGKVTLTLENELILDGVNQSTSYTLSGTLEIPENEVASSMRLINKHWALVTVDDDDKIEKVTLYDNDSNDNVDLVKIDNGDNVNYYQGYVRSDSKLYVELLVDTINKVLAVDITPDVDKHYAYNVRESRDNQLSFIISDTWSDPSAIEIDMIEATDIINIKPSWVSSDSSISFTPDGLSMNNTSLYQKILTIPKDEFTDLVLEDLDIEGIEVDVHTGIKIKIPVVIKNRYYSYSCYCYKDSYSNSIVDVSIIKDSYSYHYNYTKYLSNKIGGDVTVTLTSSNTKQQITKFDLITEE